MHTHPIRLPWLSLLKPIEEGRSFTMRDMSTLKLEKVKVAANSGDVRAIRLAAQLELLLRGGV